MIFTLKVNCDNAAFHEPDAYPEIARILLRIAGQIEYGGRDITQFQTIFDSYGNDVGRYALKEESYFDDVHT